MSVQVVLHPFATWEGVLVVDDTGKQRAKVTKRILLAQFARDHPQVRVNAVLADALYGSADFMAQAAPLFRTVQVISQLLSKQKVRPRGRSWSVRDYFRAYPGVAQPVTIRGGEPVELRVGSARLYVEAQGVQCFVIAVRSPDEPEYRYLVASDLSWRTWILCKPIR